MSAWADGLLRNSIQGGLAVALVYLLFRFFPRIPSHTQVWMWRAVALKFVLGMILPITIFTRIWSAGAGIYENRVPELIVLCSGLGLLLAIASICADWAKLRQMISRGVPVELEAADRLAEKLGLSYTPTVVLRTDLDRPMLAGILNPKIHMPAGLDNAAQEMVLAHELAHVKRRDLAWEWLFVAVEFLFFFHPLVWVMRRQHRIAQESACDALAIETSGKSLSTYGRMLLDLTVADKRKELALTANMAGTYAALHTRILRLHRGGMRLGPIATLALVAMGAAIIPTWRKEFRLDVTPNLAQPEPIATVNTGNERFGRTPIGAAARTPKEGRP
jgi:hypothetical protein